MAERTISPAPPGSSIFHHFPIRGDLENALLTPFSHYAQDLESILTIFLLRPEHSPAQQAALRYLRPFLHHPDNGTNLFDPELYQHLDALFFIGQLTRYLAFRPSDTLHQSTGLRASTTLEPAAEPGAPPRVQIAYDTYSLSPAHRNPQHARSAAIADILHQMLHAWFLVFGHASLPTTDGQEHCTLCQQTLPPTLETDGHGLAWVRLARLTGEKLLMWAPGWRSSVLEEAMDPLGAGRGRDGCFVPALGWVPGGGVLDPRLVVLQARAREHAQVRVRAQPQPQPQAHAALQGGLRAIAAATARLLDASDALAAMDPSPAGAERKWAFVNENIGMEGGLGDESEDEAPTPKRAKRAGRCVGRGE